MQEIREYLKKIKGKAFSEIRSASEQGNLTKISHFAEIATEAEKLLTSYDCLEKSVINLEQKLVFQKDVRINNDKRMEQPLPLPESRNIGEKPFKGKAWGKNERGQYIQFLKSNGIKLVHKQGTIYLTQNGRKVGIAAANEVLKNQKWFLGIDDGNYDFIVLLCKSSSGELLDFVLPKSFLSGVWGKLSKSGSNVKFNISQKHNKYFFHVTGYDPEVIGEYLHKYYLLQD